MSTYYLNHARHIPWLLKAAAVCRAYPKTGLRSRLCDKEHAVVSVLFESTRPKYLMISIFQVNDLILIIHILAFFLFYGIQYSKFISGRSGGHMISLRGKSCR